MIPPLRKSKKMLAINWGGIGDEILFLPTLKIMRQAQPDASLTLLLEPRSRSFEQITNLVDGTITFDIKKSPLTPGDLVQLVRLIRAGGYELILSSGGSAKVSVLLFLTGSDFRIGYDSGSLSRLLLTHPVPLNKEQYAGQMYRDLARPLIDESAWSKLGLAVPQAEAPTKGLDLVGQALNGLLDRAGLATKDSGTENIKRVLLHPGTSRLAIQKGIIKTWPIDSWTKLIQMLSADKTILPILAGGPDDQETVLEILAHLPNNSRLISMVGETRNLSDLASLIFLSDVLVCVDSAPMHLGVALGKRVVAMFGPTDEKKLLPHDPRFKALRAPLNSSQPLNESQAEPGVQLQPGTVFRSVLDQLQELKAQEHPQALPH